MKSARILPACLLSLGLMFAACAPDGGKAPIGKAGRSGASAQKSRICQDRLTSGKLSSIGKAREIQICAYTGPEKLSAEQEAALRAAPFAAGEHYKPVALAVKVEATRNESMVRDESGKLRRDRKAKAGITVNVRAYLNLPVTLTDAQANRVTELVNACSRQSDRVWANAKRNLMPSVQYISGMALDEDQDFDQELKVLHRTDKGGRLVVAIAEYPFHSEANLDALPLCKKECADQATSKQRSQCEFSCLARAREPFCQSLAKLTAHWIGLQDPLAATGCQMPTDGLHPAAASRSIVAGYIAPSRVSVQEGSTQAAERKVDEQKVSAPGEARPLETAEDTSLVEHLDESQQIERLLNEQAGLVAADTRGATIAPSEPLDTSNFWNSVSISDAEALDILGPACNDVK